MGKLTFQAALGGTVDLVGPNTASTVTLNLPSASGDIVGTGSTGVITTGMISGQIAVAQGGTGSATAQTAINTLAGAVTSGSYLRGNGTNVVMATIQAADLPTLNQNTTGTAGNVTGIVAVANGGTGTSTPALIAGTNVSITGSWPNQTITASGGGGGGSGTYSRTSYSATAGQTVFAVVYSVTYLQVYVNGVLLAPSDYIATNGFNFTLSTGCNAGDLVDAVVITATVTSGVSSVDVSGGTTGLTTSGGPVTATGTITLAGTLAVANGGTGLTTAPANGALDIGNGTGFARGTLTAGSGISITNGAGSITIASSVTAVTSVTGTSPVVSSGGATPAISLAAAYGDTLNPYASKTANYVLAAPSGTAGVPTFRAIVSADIPTLNQNTTGTAANITATSNSTLTTLSVLSLPGSQVSGNISGNAANVTGTVAIANGGTGATTAAAAFNAISPLTTTGDIVYEASAGTAARLPIGTTGQVLSVVGGVPSWTTSSGSGTVTSVAATVPAFLSISGSPITTSGTLAISYSGTALPVANGGTGTTTGSLVNCTVDGTNAVGYLNVPQNAQTGAYTLVLADGGKHIYHASGSAAATYTIPAASSVAFPIGTVISFINLATAAVTISITTDTMYLTNTGTTGSRTLAQYGIATATKVSGLSATGIWVISGAGLT
jgi:hypothetical protein